MQNLPMAANANPQTLPREYLIDVIRAFLRTTPASQEQAESIETLDDAQLVALVDKLLIKGARISAHLIKSKQFGYGALTFGYNGQVPPGRYTAMTVAGKVDARRIATRYGAVMWNF